MIFCIIILKLSFSISQNHPLFFLNVTVSVSVDVSIFAGHIPRVKHGQMSQKFDPILQRQRWIRTNPKNPNMALKDRFLLKNKFVAFNKSTAIDNS